MLSFIICSIHPEEASRLSANIASTVGVCHEVIVMDNRDRGDGICSVYNRGASMAAGNNLCFVHEDVIFHGNDWGRAVEQQLSCKGTGVIGFMGAVYKSLSPSGWNVDRGINRSHFIQTADGLQRTSSEGVHGEFSSCAVLDGACLFMRRDVWRSCPFDAENIRGFHCYDIDVCLQTAACGLVNYVCGTVWIEHLSSGSFSPQWAKTTLELHQGKWKRWLPVTARDLAPEEEAYIERNRPYLEARSFYIFLKNQGKVKRTKEEKLLLRSYLPSFFRHPLIHMKCLKFLL
ncbi:MAG: glycosyltransferase family protein [Prevotella sp.]|nr:glycosyltransferase family protein [Prevotella sp.]